MVNRPVFSNRFAGNVALLRKQFSGYVCAALFMLTYSGDLYSNGITLTVPEIVDQNTGMDFAFVQTTVSWENSWRLTEAPSNWDAAWIFIKYRIGNNPWSHATLNAVGHIVPDGCVVSTSSDGKGVFVYRSQDGYGSFSATNLRLRWNYGADGISDDAAIEMRVYAIETVFIPQSSFYAGDGSTTQVQGHFGDAVTNQPYLISSENAISLGGTVSGSLGNNNRFGQTDLDDFYDSQTQILPLQFPKGYAAIYCMKYEMSQGQYADFLNTLSPTQAVARFPNQDGNARHSISFNGSSYVASMPDIACNFISWADAAAYLDWSGLRPWTELELEKVSRGPLAPVADEYSFGSASATLVQGVSGAGQPDESASNTSANLVANNILTGPMRVGWASGGTRAEASASYYGVLDISGNVAEVVISVGNSMGRSFTGSHGDGVLTSFGESDVPSWPSSDAVGTGRKCGHWDWTPDWPRVSARAFASGAYAGRTQFFGLRGVRTAP